MQKKITMISRPIRVTVIFFKYLFLIFPLLIKFIHELFYGVYYIFYIVAGLPQGAFVTHLGVAGGKSAQLVLVFGGEFVFVFLIFGFGECLELSIRSSPVFGGVVGTVLLN